MYAEHCVKTQEVKIKSLTITNLEVNFGIGNNVEKQKEKQRKMIAQIDARMRSRFLRGTYLPTLNIIISSKDTEQAFLNTYIELKKRNESKTSLIIDEPQWVVDSRKGTPDDPGAFYVAIGNKFLAHELLPVNADEALVEAYREKGYQMLKVPPGYREVFEDNLDQALMDIAGYSTSSNTKYISGIRVNQVKTDSYKNPFTKDVIEVGNSAEDHLQYSNFFDMSRVNPTDLARPLFIHLDMSMTGDKTGIAGVWITGKSPTIQDDDTSRTLQYKLAFSVSIKAPKGFQVSFEKNRNFIKWLRDQGFAIKMVSSDTFQSATILQELKSDGFNTSVLSVDRVDPQTRLCQPYNYFKSTIYERHIQIYQKCDLLTDEIVGLERKSDGHIDHTPDGINCLTGDTKVSLVDGREVMMQDLVKEFDAGKENYVYTVNENTLKIEPKLIENAFKSGVSKKLIVITLDNDEIIRCTPNHRFMLRNGVYCEARNLKIDDSLFSTKSINKTVDLFSNRHVSSIQTIEYEEDVYDLTIKDNHNFALTAGIFVHNSKDQADAFCGALFDASKFSEEYSYNYGENLNAAFEVNDLSEAQLKSKMLTEFQEELSKVYFENNRANDIAKKQEYEYYADISDGIVVI